MAQHERKRNVKARKRDLTKDSFALTDIDIKSLPTGGLGYPDNAKIKFRTYTFGEIKRSSTSSKDIIGSLKLAMRCLTVSNLERENISIMDMFYIGLIIKASSLGGEKFELPYICPHCQTQGKKVLTQNNIDFRELDERIQELPIEAEIAGRILKFAPMTVKEFIDLYSGSYDQILVDNKPDTIGSYAMLCKSLGFKEAYDLFNNITDAEDMEVLEEIDKSLMHNLEPVKVKCENLKCGMSISVQMEGKEALLRTFRSGEKLNRPRIFFGPSSKHKPDEFIPNGVSDSDSVEQTLN